MTLMQLYLAIPSSMHDTKMPDEFWKSLTFYIKLSYVICVKDIFNICNW